MRMIVRLMAASLLAAPAIASAASAVLQSRESVLYATDFGGFAIVQTSGSDGTLTPITSLFPASLLLQGDDGVKGRYLQTDVTFTAAWSLTQTWSIGPEAHTISGNGATHVEVGGELVGPGCGLCLPTMQAEGRNGQAIIFNLDAATPYSFSSVSSPLQFMELQLWGEAGQRWVGLWSGPTVAQGVEFNRSGTLQAGRYRLINNFADLRANHLAMSRDSSWNYTLTLPDAQVSAVPEPVPAALLTVGLGLLALRRRHKADA